MCVYNVLGLEVAEVDAGCEGPVVAVEWVQGEGDRLGDASPDEKGKEEEGDSPEDEIGTVRRTTPLALPLSPNIHIPFPFDGTKDLFSSLPFPSPSPAIHNAPHQASDLISGRAPAFFTERTRRQRRPRRQSFVRPRIARETFLRPNKSGDGVGLGSMGGGWVGMESRMEVELRRREKQVFDVFFKDALRMPSNGLSERERTLGVGGGLDWRTAKC